MNLPSLKAFLDRQGLPHDAVTLKRIEQYTAFLMLENQKYNLTALEDESSILLKHFADSLLFSKRIALTHETLLDLGSGAGFPGIPLKLMYPALKVTLLEPNQKKARFLNEVVRMLGLSGIEVVSERAEILAAAARSTFDVVVARALAPLPILLELAIPLLKREGRLWSYKGKEGPLELQRAKSAMDTLGVALDQTLEEKLPESDDVRLLFIFKKTKETPSKYPRPYTVIKQKTL